MHATVTQVVASTDGVGRFMDDHVDERSAYERERDTNIARNNAHLHSLGLESPIPRRTAAPKRAQRPKSAEPTRASKRQLHASPDYTGKSIDEYGDDEARLKREVQGVKEEAPPKQPKRPRAKPQPRVPSAVVEGVRAFLDDNVPAGMVIEEKTMFGMNMWMLRGNMFLGVGLQSQRLLVRVGEDCVEDVLSAHPVGVARCGAATGRVFRGTLMVEIEQYRGSELLSEWFDLAMAYNATMQAKEPNEKPKKKR